MRYNIFHSIVLKILFAGALSGQAFSGAITGRVVDEKGKPIPEATVLWYPAGPFEGILPTTSTNTEGEFSVGHLPAGRTQICAFKVSAGYPDTTLVGFSDLYPPCPEVTVQTGQVVKNVVIRLGPKAGRLTGRVADAGTGQAIAAHVRLELLDGQGSAAFLSTGPDKKGEFAILVPFDKPFGFRVRAPGYETWYCCTDGTKEHAAPIQMKPGELQELTVRLNPIKANPN